MQALGIVFEQVDNFLWEQVVEAKQLHEWYSEKHLALGALRVPRPATTPSGSCYQGPTCVQRPRCWACEHEGVHSNKLAAAALLNEAELDYQAWDKSQVALAARAVGYKPTSRGGCLGRSFHSTCH